MNSNASVYSRVYHLPREVVKKTAKVVMPVRLKSDLIGWLDAQAMDAGIDRTALVESVLMDYRAYVEKAL